MHTHTHITCFLHKQCLLSKNVARVGVKKITVEKKTWDEVIELYLTSMQKTGLMHWLSIPAFKTDINTCTIYVCHHYNFYACFPWVRETHFNTVSPLVVLWETVFRDELSSLLLMSFAIFFICRLLLLSFNTVSLNYHSSHTHTHQCNLLFFTANTFNV